MRAHLLWAMALFAAGCTPSEVHEARFIMGTIVNFTVCGADADVARAAITAAARRMQAIDDAFTIARPLANPVQRFNAAPVGAPVPVPEELDRVLGFAVQMQQETRGWFHPGIGKLTQLWGFDRTPPPKAPPREEAIRRALPPSQCFRHSARGWVRLHGNCLLDPGGFVKGYAADEAVHVLAAHGISHALVDAGGDIRLLGDHCGRPWRIGIRDPRGRGVLGVVELADTAIVTSGDYEHFFLYEGRRYHHLLDPHTGYPAKGLVSVTVVAPTTMRADAAATGLFVAGPKRIRALARKLGVQALWVDANLRVHRTRGFPALQDGFARSSQAF